MSEAWIKEYYSTAKITDDESIKKDKAKAYQIFLLSFISGLIAAIIQVFI